MERMSVLPYDWFNKIVRVEAYSGETTHPFASASGISDPTLLREEITLAGWKPQI